MIKKVMIAVGLILLVACGNDDAYDKLEGKWQLQQVEENGIVQHADTVYYNFQQSLFMLQVYIPAQDKFRHSYGFNTREGDDKILLELTSNPQPVADFIKLTDWTSARRLFTIEKANRKELIMQSDGKRYTFRKF